VPLTGVRIDVVARGTASAVTVAQRYVNREKVPVEAVYSFPLEEQAAVCGFEALVGEKRVSGHVVEKEMAFEEYDQAMADGHGAYLLDEDRANLFTASIGNLLPGQQAIVTVQYVAPLERTGEQFRLKIPTTVAPRYIPAEQLRQMDPAEFDHLTPPTVAGGVPYGLALTVAFEGASDVLGVECPSHPIKVTIAGKQATVELSGADLQLDRDVVVSFTLAEAGATALHAVRDAQGDYVLMLDLLAPLAEARRPVEAVLLIDRSGSMDGSSIAQARNALLLALGSLREGDSFNVYGFGSTFESVFAAPVPYDDANLNLARDAVQRWDADLGGTELMAPLRAILERPATELPRRVLLLTDGEVGNEQECVALVGAHAAAATVFTIGVGYGASDLLINGVARAGGGRAELVHPNERIEAALMRQMSRLTTEGLRDVRVDWAGLPVDLTAPAVLPPLYPGTPLTVYGRVPAARLAAKAGREGPVEVALVATGPAGEVRFAATADLAAALPDAAIPRLFAREAIRDLEENRSAAAGRGSQQRARKEHHVKDAIIALAMRYTLMSSATSFVAVEEREGATADLPAAELRRIPVALLEDWHGSGRVQMSSAMMTSASPPPAPGDWNMDVIDEMAFDMEAPAASGAGFAAMGDVGQRDDIIDYSDEIPGADTMMRELVRTQRADGSWAWSDAVLAYLGLGRVDCEPLFADLGLEAVVADLVGPTLLALGILACDFAELEDQWRPLADKALDWLAGQGVTAPRAPHSLDAWMAAWLHSVRLDQSS
jgi:Ca-activated chloride channel family protein